MATISERLRENADFVGREDTRKTVNEAADTIDALVEALETARHAIPDDDYFKVKPLIDAALARAKG